MSEDIKVQYRSLQVHEPEYRERLILMYEVETRVAIVLTIVQFGPSNIKKLARILSKNEATIHHHIQWLTSDPALIILDTDTTVKRKGKYYKLAEPVQNYFYDPGQGEEGVAEIRAKVERIDKLLKMSDADIYKFHLDMIKNHPEGLLNDIKERQLMAYNHTLENMILNNFKQALTELAAGNMPKNKQYPFGSLSNFALDMQVSSSRHLFEIVKLFTQMQVSFVALKNRIHEEMEIEKIPEEDRIDMHFHIVGGEIAQFEFE